MDSEVVNICLDINPEKEVHNHIQKYTMLIYLIVNQKGKFRLFRGINVNIEDCNFEIYGS